MARLAKLVNFDKPIYIQMNINLKYTPILNVLILTIDLIRNLTPLCDLLFCNIFTVLLVREFESS